MEKTGVHKCELCDKQFKSRQSKWMHKQRSHPTGTITTTDIEDRIVLLEKRIKEMQDEIDPLRAKQASITNNNFSGNNVVNMSNCQIQGVWIQYRQIVGVIAFQSFSSGAHESHHIPAQQQRCIHS